jgi:hypothetical protein
VRSDKHDTGSDVVKLGPARWLGQSFGDAFLDQQLNADSAIRETVRDAEHTQVPLVRAVAGRFFES